VKLTHVRLVCQTRRGFAGSDLPVAPLRAAPDPQTAPSGTSPHAPEFHIKPLGDGDATAERRGGIGEEAERAFFSVTFQAAVATWVMPVFLLTPPPLRWKLCLAVRSRTVIV